MNLETFSIASELIQSIGFSLVLYILPGLGVLSWLWQGRELSWGEQLGLSASISLALLPIYVLWAYLVGFRLGFLFPWVLGGAGFAAWFWFHWRNFPTWRQAANQWLTWQRTPDYAYLVLIGVLIITRLSAVRSMVAPAWGDSVHHTLIVQLMLDQGGLFQSWAPYEPLRSFTYHFGYHAAMANWAWLSGMDAAHAVLIGSQMLNVLAVITLYPLAVSLAGGTRWAGVVAVLVAGLLVQMPAFYVNWGRYTQLAGQAILPGLLWALDAWWAEKTRPAPRLLLLIACLATGMVLTHYRIAAITAMAGLAWALWALWMHRHDLQEWMRRMGALVGASALVAGIILPWVFIVQTSRLAYVAGAIAQQGLNPEIASGDLVAWGSADAYYTRLIWVSAVVAIGVASWRRPKLAALLTLWSLFTFLATNPYLLRLPGAGLVNNFTLVIGAYIPIALAIGWLAGVLWQWLAVTYVGRFLAIAAFCLLTVYGARQQVRIVDPFFQMVTPADENAFSWINQNVPAASRFLVNGFLAFADAVVVGSDAGWWLPYYTQRENTVPPILYIVEQLAAGVDPQQFRQLALDLRASNGEPGRLQAILCQAAITHVYLGDLQGQVGVGAMPLIPTAWLTDNPDFKLLYQDGNAQVWAFDRTACSTVGL